MKTNKKTNLVPLEHWQSGINKTSFKRQLCSEQKDRQRKTDRLESKRKIEIKIKDKNVGTFYIKK